MLTLAFKKTIICIYNLDMGGVFPADKQLHSPFGNADNQSLFAGQSHIYFDDNPKISIWIHVVPWDFRLLCWSLAANQRSSLESWWPKWWNMNWNQA